MSLVLAFGLSPIGQAPAYAAEKGGTVSAQSAEITTQAEPTDTTAWKVITPAKTYAHSDLRAEILGNTTVKYFPTGGSALVEIPVGGDIIAKLELKSGSKLLATWNGTYTPDNGENIYTKDSKGDYYKGSTKETTEKTISAMVPYIVYPEGLEGEQITTADTYTVTAVGTSNIDGASNSGNAVVAPLDITEANAKIVFAAPGATPEANLAPSESPLLTDLAATDGKVLTPDMSYTAKDQTIVIHKHDAATSVPYFKFGADDKPASYEAITYTAVTSAGDGAVKDFGNYAITMTANGNFTGTIGGFSQQVGRSAFYDRTDLKLAVADAVGTLSTTATDTVVKQSTGALSDPAGQGKVTYNDIVLTRGSEYTATYRDTSMDTDPDPKKRHEATETAPTAIGSYEVVLTAAGNNFLTTDGTTQVKFTYNIVPASVEDATWASFSDVTFNGLDSTKHVYAVADEKAGNLLDEKGNVICSVEEGGYKVVPYGTLNSGSGIAKQFSVYGKTSKVTATFTTAYIPWTQDLEQALLGEDAFKAKYKAYGYTNTAADATTSVDTTNQTWSVTTPGDYAVLLTTAATAAAATDANTVIARMTVKAADSLAQGDAVGNLYAYKSATGNKDIKGNSITNTYAGNVTAPTLGIITKVATDPTTNPNPATANALRYAVDGTDHVVKTAQSTTNDYSITYINADGKEFADTKYALANLDAGTYSAKYTFKNGAAGTEGFTVEGALVIDPANINTVINNADASLPVQKADNLTYTGYGLDPELTLTPATGKTATDVSALKLGKDYKLLWDAGTSGTLDSDGKPVGIASTYTAKLVGLGNYADPKAEHAIAVKGLASGGKFQVKPLDLSAENTNLVVLFEDGTVTPDKTYRTGADGTAKTPSFRLVVKDEKGDYSNPKVVDSLLYNVDYANNVAAHGGAKITLTAKDTIKVDSSTSRVVNFELTDAAFDATKDYITFSADSATYKNDNGATDLMPTYSVTAGGQLIGEGAWYEMTITDEQGRTYVKGSVTDAEKQFNKITEAGTYTFTATGGTNGYYSGELVKEFKVNPIEIGQSDLYDSKTNKNGKFDATALTTFDYAYANKKATKYTAAIDKLVADTDKLNTIALYYDNKPLAAYKYDVAPAKGSESNSTAQRDEKTGELIVKDYTVENNVNDQAGEYEAIVTFQGNFSGTVKVPWSIKPIDIADSENGGASKYYVLFEDAATGHEATLQVPFINKEYEPKVWVSATNVGSNPTVVADPSFKYTVSYENNKNAYNRYTNWQGARAVVVAEGNYTGTIYQNFTITPLDIAGKDVAVEWGDQLGYTSSPIEPQGKLTYTYADGTKYDLVYGTDYTTEYEGARTNVGDQGIVTFYGQGNFGSYPEGGITGTRAETFTVAKGTQTITASDKSVEAGKTVPLGASSDKGSELKYASSDEKVATVAADGTVTGVAAGTAKITITAEESANLKAASAEVTVTVTAAAIQVEAPKAATGLKYTGKAQTGVAAAEGYTVTGGSAAKAGSYTATAKLASGYQWADGTTADKTVKWTIAKAANKLTAKAAKGAKKKAALKAKVGKQASFKAVATVKGATGKVTLKNVSKNKLCKAYKVTYKSGKINLVVPKGKVNKGVTRQVIIQVKAAGNANVASATKVVKLYVKGVK